MIEKVIVCNWVEYIPSYDCLKYNHTTTASMSLSGDIFEPKVIYNILKNLLKDASKKKTFEKWGENVCTPTEIHPSH